MAPPRRARSDSASAAVEAFRQASTVIAWPAEIEQLADPMAVEKASSVFHKIIAGRSVQDWSDAAILLAAQLAKATVLADQLTSEIERRGFTVPSPNNPAQQLRNPALDALNQLSGRCLSINRMLQVSGGADRRTLGNGRRAAETVRQLSDGAGSLLAGFEDPPGERTDRQ